MHAGFHVIMLCLVDYNSFSVITRPSFAQFEGCFPVLFYCINCGKSKRCLIRDLIFFWGIKALLEHVISLNSCKW